MITITIHDDEDITTLFSIIMELKQISDCLSGECNHEDDGRDEE